jgi:flagellar motor switch protein FliN
LEENFPFPWGDASHAIGSAIGVKDLTLSASRTVWKGPGEVLQGLGDRPFLVSVEVSPIAGSVFFALSKHDVAHLTSRAVSTSEHKEGFSNAKLQEGFYHFLFLKALQAIDHLKIFKEVAFHFSPASSLPQENAFCIDIDCTFPEKTLKGRLICPQSFLSAFKAHQPMQKSTLLSSEATHNIEVTLRSEVGMASISPEEWEKINVGDFVMLDRCSYNPLEEKGSVTLLLGETPLLIARMKSEGMKILDYAFYQEDMPTTENQFILTAEIGRIRLPLQKLLHLQPGAMIDLIQRPEQGVDITINGKKVASGELLKLGETIGLRILDVVR